MSLLSHVLQSSTGLEMFSAGLLCVTCPALFLRLYHQDDGLLVGSCPQAGAVDLLRPADVEEVTETSVDEELELVGDDM